MINTTSQQRKSRLAFTLTELIIVVAIIAVLAGILIPLLIGYTRDAKERRLVVACRTCVDAANVLAAKQYVASGEENFKKGFDAEAWDEKVREYAGIEKGKCYAISFDYIDNSSTGGTKTPPTFAVNNLTYKENENDDISVTYFRKPTPHYALGENRTWVKGDYYNEGDLMVTDTFVLRCLKAHKSGSKSNTRDPTAKSNKGTWEVIGGANGTVPAYNATVRFAVGVWCTFNGNVYARTTYNLTGGQTPYSKSSSRYWTLLGPVAELMSNTNP